MTRCLPYLVLTLASVLLPWAPAGADDGVLIDLNQVGSTTELDTLKHGAGVRWWLELGEQLLLAGDEPAMRRGLGRGRHVLASLGEVSPGTLALHARSCADSIAPAASFEVLVSGSRFDLVRRPRSFSPAGDSTQGGTEWLPVVANSTVARLHRFDRPQGFPPADPGIQAIIDRVDAQRWYDTVVALADWDRSSWSTELTLARQWVAGELSALGLAVSEPPFTLTYQGNPTSIANVVGRVEGHSLPGEWVIVGAHLDSRNQNNSPSGTSNTPGADDNASGCAGVLEMARVLVAFRPQRTVLFVCYSGEEQGLHGSHHHVGALNADNDLARVKAMLNLDMIGWVSPSDPTLGVSLGTKTSVGNATANLALMTQIADAAGTYVPQLVVTTSTSSCCSDHVPYLDGGRPAVHSIHRGGAGAYPGWHHAQVADTPAALGASAQAIGAAIIRTNLASLAQLSGASDRIFQDGHEL